MFVVNTMTEKKSEKTSATQLKSRLKAYSVIRKSGPMQYVPGHDVKKKPTTHQTHTYIHSSHYYVYYKSKKYL